MNPPGDNLAEQFGRSAALERFGPKLLCPDLSQPIELRLLDFGDVPSDFGQSGESLALVLKAIIAHQHFVLVSLPFTHQHHAWLELCEHGLARGVPVEAGDYSVELLLGPVAQATEVLFLDSPGDDLAEQLGRAAALGRLTPEFLRPDLSQAIEGRLLDLGDLGSDHRFAGSRQFC